MTFPILKCAAVIFAAATMGLGLHSHFQSSWVKGWEGYEKPYKMCDNQKLIGEKKCPTIKLELFFISIGIIAFVCSLGWLIVGVAYINTKFYPKFLKWIEILYHVTFGVLLVVGGGMYIVSSEQIMKLIGTDEEFEEANPGLEANFLRLEKLAAAGTAGFQMLTYGAITLQTCTRP